MAKKTLDEKIDNIKKIFFIGTPTYILLSLLLLNDYSYEAHFDPKKVYDVIKDGFTLSAAFLAPVAAFVLFSDWREPHIEKIIEDDSSKIYEGINNGINELLRILIEIEDSDNFKENNDSIPANLIDALSKKIENLNMLNAHLGARGSATKNFTECAADLLEQIRWLSVELAMLCTYQLKIHNPHIYNDLICDDQEFSEHIQEKYSGLHSQILQNFPEFRTLERKLKTQCDELKIKV